jgi:hypothetical protein
MLNAHKLVRTDEAGLKEYLKNSSGSFSGFTTSELYKCLSLRRHYRNYAYSNRDYLKDYEGEAVAVMQVRIAELEKEIERRNKKPARKGSKYSPTSDKAVTLEDGIREYWSVPTGKLSGFTLSELKKCLVHRKHYIYLADCSENIPKELVGKMSEHIAHMEDSIEVRIKEKKKPRKAATAKRSKE